MTEKIHFSIIDKLFEDNPNFFSKTSFRFI